MEQAHRKVGRERLKSKGERKNPPYKKGAEANATFRKGHMDVFLPPSFVSRADRNNFKGGTITWGK
jgi:hypothetical protein